MNKTRYIYNEGQGDITLNISNDTDVNYGGQVWIDNLHKVNTKSVNFIVLPSMFKIVKNGRQIIRLKNIGNDIRKDQESLFFINVLEMPPRPKNAPDSFMQVALQTRVKLIYRPSSLQKSRLAAEKEIKIERVNHSYQLINPTPYYFAISKVKVDGKLIKFNQSVDNKLGLFSPKSSVILSEVKIKPSSKITIYALDDFGSSREYIING
ncbi:fimbria/pilus periplasmic chaperone [Photobacterium sp. SKA34]|uniref:fimbria/pilus periplasmic chaperone n=1 Tax=Photobacterium sp. SKA34 TaxID=121723 RepID=UPI0018DE0AA5|nr:fimbria/pilus periplasmic chaperone [Photobacterium sp. SKA34]